jgi:hypothetical protein
MGATPRTEEVDAARLVEVALRYAAHGWPVVPLHSPQGAGCSCRVDDCASRGKHPRTARGLHDASTDAGRIGDWWRRWPDANLGVATGAASGLVVLDIDLPDGPPSLARLEAQHAPLPSTCEQRTGSGGRQLLFAHPGHPIGNRAGLQPGIDVRGDGGYIVVPPSTHASGARYRWTGRVPPTPAPDWLLEVLDRSRSPSVPVVKLPECSVPTGSREQRYAASALRDELARVAAAVQGSRNDTLNRAAFNLGQLAGAGLLDRNHVAGELEAVAIGNGLGPAETRRTIASGLAAGLQHPRAAPVPAPPPPAGRGVDAPVRRIAARRR